MYLEQLLEMTPEERYLKLWDFAPSERLLAKRELEAYIRRSPPHPAWPGLIGAVVGIGLNGLLQASGYWTVLYSGMLGLGALASLFWFAMSLARQAANERDWPVVAALAEDIVEIQEQRNLPLGGSLRPGYLENLANDLDAHVHAHTVRGMSTFDFTWETLPKPVIEQAQRLFDLAPTNPKIREWAKRYIGAARVESFRTPGGASAQYSPSLEIRKLMKDHAGTLVRDELYQVPLDPDGGMPADHLVGIGGDGKTGQSFMVMKGRKPAPSPDYATQNAAVAAMHKREPREQMLAEAAAAQVAAIDAEFGSERVQEILRGEPLPPMEPTSHTLFDEVDRGAPAYHSPAVEHHSTPDYSTPDYSAPADHHHDTTGGDFGSGSYE